MSGYISAGTIALGLLASSLTAAQSWPAKPVRIITSAPGSPYDIVLRGFAAQLGPAVGQSMVIENRPGANNILIGDTCARGSADGYTLCSADVYMTIINAHLFPKLSYDPRKDFAPVIHFGYIKGGLIAHPSVPANNIGELFALAKASPNTYTFGTPGPATLPSMLVEYMRRTLNIEFTAVPYKSFIQSATAVVSGEVRVGTVGLGQAMSFAKANRAKLLATTSGARSAFAPNLVSLTESGIDFAIDSWGGVLAPTGTPRDVLQRLNIEFAKLIGDAAFREKFLDAQTFEQAAPSGGTPEEFGAFLRTEDVKYGRIIKVIGDLATPEQK